MTTTTDSRGSKVNADITALLKARNTLLWLATKEEERVENALVDAAAAADRIVLFWDCADGITGPGRAKIAPDMFNPADAQTQRKLRSVVRYLKSVPRAEARGIVVLTPSVEIPPELAGHAVLIDYPLPDRAEVAAILDGVLSAVPEQFRAGAAPNGTRDAAIDAAMGLSKEEIESCFARSLVTSSPPRIDASLVGAEKKKAINRQGLQVHDPDPRGLDAIGGLDLLKDWVRQMKVTFTPKAREFGLEPPKGVVLVGPPGTGKSLGAKAFATALGLPLFRADLGAQKSKYVGESEQNIRRLIGVAEAAAPCVLWVDEIDKVLKGASGDQGDGGVAADQLGVLLNWMQETKAPVFVIATANSVEGLPPELLRKGRFAEVFFVDLPNRSERVEVLRVSLKAKGLILSESDVEEVADKLDGYTGSEINALVPDAMVLAYNDGERRAEARDLLAVAANVVPLSKLASDKIQALRKWAENRARRASSPEKAKTGPSRVLDIG